MNIICRINGTCGKDKVGGWSATFADKQLIGGEANTTHHRMELRALINAIKSVPRSKETTQLTIVTKNNYIPNAMKNFRFYQSNGFRSHGNTPIHNLDLWEQVITEAKKRNVFIIHHEP